MQVGTAYLTPTDLCSVELRVSTKDVSLLLQGLEIGKKSFQDRAKFEELQPVHINSSAVDLDLSGWEMGFGILWLWIRTKDGSSLKDHVLKTLGNRAQAVLVGRVCPK